MAMSGLKVLPECTQTYQDMQIHKKSDSKDTPSRPLRALIMQISKDKKSVEIAEKIEVAGEDDSEQESEYENIIRDHVPKNSGRWIVLDLCVKPQHTGQETKRLACLSWAPDDAPVTERMLYASSSDYVKKALKVPNWIQCNDESDLSYATILDKVTKGK